MQIWRYLLLSLACFGLLFPLPLAADEPEAEAAEKKTVSDEEYYDLLRLFVDTLDQVERNYVKDLSRRELFEAAIEGMVSELDQHSEYIAPDDLDRFKSGVESEFGGIGIQVSRRRGRLSVISPLVGSPAYRAGVMAGDVITHIRGEPVNGISLDDAVQKMKGPVGTSVKITVRHPHDGSTEEVELKREIVRVETVMGNLRESDDSWDFMVDNEHKIGYLRVTAFARHTVADVRRALRQLTSDGMKGLILDLRFNPGGLLSAAIQVSDMFIHGGRIVSTAGRNIEGQHWDARRRGTFDGFTMVVLVNEYSASASEIVAACLQDHERAIVIGERTYGKGSVQNIIELEHGRSALKLTTARYQRPSGKNIHRFPGTDEDEDWGVRPNEGFKVELSDADMRRLVLQRQADDVARRGQPAASEEVDETDEEAEEFVDAALKKAIEYLQDSMAEVAAKTDGPSE
jgi:carboxyl-terminal processing protease